MIKNEIQRSAEQLGRSVRHALADFTRETGLSAQIEIEWIAIHQLSEAAPTQLAGCIRVNVAGLSVEA